jgi:hypothetical protein
MAWLVVKLREDYEVCMLGGYRCRCMGWSSATSSAVSRFWSRRERSGSRKRAARAPSGSDSFCPESAYARAHRLFTIMSLPPLPGLTYTPATACLHSCQWIPRPRARLQLWNGTATRLVFDDRMPLKIIFNGCTPLFLRKFARLHTTDCYTAIAMTLDMLGVASHTSRLLTVARYALDQREVAWWRGTGAR